MELAHAVDYILPSKTDDESEGTELNVPSTVVKERLSSGELEYLRSLEEKNRNLTMTLGDKLMEADQAKTNLHQHREVLRNAYLGILRVHGVAEGRIDTKLGELTVLVRASKE